MGSGWHTNAGGLEVIYNGMKAATNLPNDPENTLNVALTQRELGLITFALFFPWRIFPEISEEINELCEKLVELTVAQEFLEDD